MPNVLTLDDLNPDVKHKVYLQDYSPKKQIEDVKNVEIKPHAGHDGDFCEIIKVNQNQEIEAFPGFKIAQLNYSSMFPGAIKAWHLHYNQDEIWYVAPQFHLIVGLWDVRQNSKTSGVSTKIVLGGSEPALLYIPRGVAHGVVNNSQKTASLLYIVNNTFNPDKPDENRLPWDIQGSSFWLPDRD